jgi:hypothetical protein
MSINLRGDPPHKCLLCGENAKTEVFYRSAAGSFFWKCTACGYIFLDPQFHLSSEVEKSRYQLHDNRVDDPGYQNFLRPTVDFVSSCYGVKARGLDFGCGPASVVSYMLRGRGYQVEDYDPLFFPREDLLRHQYDFVTCTEVVEHFTKPRESWSVLLGLVADGGSAFIKTGLTDSISDFSRWHYHRDPTHVGFYSIATFKHVARMWGFSDVEERAGVVRLVR